MRCPQNIDQKFDFLVKNDQFLELKNGALCIQRKGDGAATAGADAVRKARDFVLDYRSEQAIAAFHEKRFLDAEAWFERVI